MNVLQQIREKLQRYPDSKFGFVVYRCTYANDAAWSYFMDFLNAQARKGLLVSGVDDLISRLDWNVQEHPRLDGANMEEVRNEFRRWIHEGEEVNRGTPRHYACLMVDREALKTVTDWKDGLEEFDMFGVTWVYLISSMNEGPDPNADDDDDEEQEEEDDDDEDEDEEQDDDDEENQNEDHEKESNAQENSTGSQINEALEEVSYTRVGISYLIPRVYELLAGSGWHSFAYPESGVVRD